MQATSVHCFKCSVLDTLGLNKFNGIPQLEVIFGNLTPASKAGPIKMNDLKRVDHIWGANGSKVDLLMVYEKSFISFNP